MNEHNKLTVAKVKHFHYANKWISNDQIDHKLSNSFWKAQQTTNAQITQILKLKPMQYMGYHMKNLFWPQKFTSPKILTKIHGHTYYMSLCNHNFTKDLQLARHNVATQQLTNLLKLCIHTRHYTFTNACNNVQGVFGHNRSKS